MKELLLLGASVVATLALALACVRWLAPGLLGLPVDLQIVQVRDAVSPFYETIFGEIGHPRELIRDPHTVVRAQPLAPDIGPRGPHDVLGFRNASVPNHADIIAIGDSHTYGAGVAFESVWPRRIEDVFRDEGLRVYTMATGGWGAVQYLDMFQKSERFAPRIVIVAFYSGNDANESFRAAYAIERWARLRPDPSLDLDDLPSRRSTPNWNVLIGGRLPMVFTPGPRLRSNEDQPAIRAGWQIMAESARRIATRARGRGATPIFTILPTKELVYEPHVRGTVSPIDADYEALVASEQRNRAVLAQQLLGLEGARYLDVLEPLRDAALVGTPVYDTTRNGHPLAAGHAVIAEVLAPAIADALAR